MTALSYSLTICKFTVRVAFVYVRDGECRYLHAPNQGDWEQEYDEQERKEG